MWKFVTRGIRETLERRVSCRTNVYSQTSNDSGCTENEVRSNLSKEQKLIAPNIVATYNNGFFGSTKTGGPNDKKYDSKWDTGKSWSDAVGWSSVLAVGWVVCQTFCLHRRVFERSEENKWQNRFLRLHSIPLSLIDTLDLHPHHVLPVTNCVADRRSDDTHDSFEQDWIAQRPYGPITIEEALKEAKDDYTKTHRLVMGEFELRFGVKALEEKRYKDALMHFSTGASLSSSGSMFNLGLCHELGIGTATNAIKAAKYYRNAAEKGHPDAMYNLGVFHAQGRGGLSLNVDKARELFIAAANLGQADAQKALILEKNIASTGIKVSGSQKTNFISPEAHDEKLKRGMLPEIAVRENSENSDKFSDETSSKISHYDDSIESIQNSTEIFLNSLGIQTNPQRVLVSTNDSNVPCYS